MLMWLLVAILAYLFFAFGSLGDKLFLDGKPKPKTYTFYVGVLGILTVLLIPFTRFGLPSSAGLIWIILDAVVRILGIYTMYVAIEKFDVSRVIATIGATQPIFIFALAWFLGSIPGIALTGSGPLSMSSSGVLAFMFLLLGSTVISFEKNPKITWGYLRIALFSSLMFSLDYIFAKIVFLNETFLPGAIWVSIFICLFVLFFLFSKKSRKEIFAPEVVKSKKMQKTFLFAQACGGLGNFLQGFAISLTPVVFLATLNSLRGIQYVFLFLMALFMSLFFPRVFREELSKKVVIRKIIAILLISVGLAILVF